MTQPSPKRTEPTRSLTDQAKPLRYKPAANTDIRETFKKFERLERMRANSACHLT